MSRIHSIPYQLQHLQTEQQCHSEYAKAAQQQSLPPQRDHLLAGMSVNLNAMPTQVTIGRDAFFTGILKSRLNAVSRLYLRSSLTPDACTPLTHGQNGKVSYLVNHHNKQGEHEVLAVSVDVDKNKYLIDLVATRLSDQQVMVEARFDSKVNLFGKKLIDGIRSKIADHVQDTMLATGPRWSWGHQSVDSLKIKSLSTKNMQTLKSQVSLKTLKRFERNFIKSVIDAQLYLTHATPADSNVKLPDGTVGLLSRRSLLQRGTEFNTKNTTQQDIDMLANDDHVFFSLEAGDQPQKNGSRFGNKIYRFKFDQASILQNATLHLVDPLTGTPPLAALRFDAIDNHENVDVTDEVIQKLDSRSYTPSEATFHGPHMKLGLALSIIHICRESMSETLRKEIFEVESINNLINGLLRPTVMVPKYFFDRPVDEADILIRHV